MSHPGGAPSDLAPAAALEAGWQAQDGRQPGDPNKLADALVALASEVAPPRRFMSGSDVLAIGERKIAELRAEMDAYRELSSSLVVDV